MIFILIFVEIVCNTMLYMIFQYGWEPVLILRILIGFEAILEIELRSKLWNCTFSTKHYHYSIIFLLVSQIFREFKDGTLGICLLFTTCIRCFLYLFLKVERKGYKDLFKFHCSLPPWKIASSRNQIMKFMSVY